MTPPRVIKARVIHARIIHARVIHARVIHALALKNTIMSLASIYKESVLNRMFALRELGDKTFDQLSEEQLNYFPAEGSNSIAVIVRHIHGNLLSRFTNFLEEDGEKHWRDRDAEFADGIFGKSYLLGLWDDAWACPLRAIHALNDADLERTVTIRGEPHSVVDALNRNLAHLAYHVGQIVYLGKVMRAGAWQNLSVPRGQSKEHTAAMRRKFGQEP
jgi:hypothetical protein